MSWLSDAANSANNAVDNAQDYADAMADSMQGSLNFGVDTLQLAANRAFDAHQDRIDTVARAHDRLLGTTVFRAAAADLRAEVDGQQMGANSFIDELQILAQWTGDTAQILGRVPVDTHQYAHTVLPKLLDDTFGDGAVNMPAVPVSVQMLKNLFNME